MKRQMCQATRQSAAALLSSPFPSQWPGPLPRPSLLAAPPLPATSHAHLLPRLVRLCYARNDLHHLGLAPLQAAPQLARQLLKQQALAAQRVDAGAQAGAARQHLVVAHRALLQAVLQDADPALDLQRWVGRG